MLSNNKINSILANELGVDESDIKETSITYGYLEPEHQFRVRLPNGDKAVYLVYDNYESAKDAAADDLGERFQDESTVLGAAIDYFGFDRFKEYINGLDDEELEDLEYLKDDLGKEEFAQYIIDNIGVDYRGFAEFNIDDLGPAWHIADGDEEIELPNGMMAYRVG